MQRALVMAVSMLSLGLPMVIFEASPVAFADEFVDVETLEPARLFDSRTGPNAATIDQLQLGGGTIAANTETQIQIHGRASIPTTATAAIINVTAIQPQANGFITAYPCNTAPPNASTLNYTANTNIANGAIIAIGDNGNICITTSSATDLAIDITGYTPDTSDVETLEPARLFDSRTGPNAATIDQLQLGGGTIAANTETQIQIHGRASIPTTATAAIINVTAIQPQANGFITAYPCGSAAPNASTLNYTASTNIANGAIIPIGTAGKICIVSSATTHLAIDITGFIPPADEIDTTLDPATAPPTPREFTNAGFQRWCEVGADQVQCTQSVIGSGTQTALVAGFEGAAAVGVGRSSVCAQFPAGDIACFGSNSEGQLGDGTTLDSDLTVAVIGIDDARDVDAGLTNFACAARRTGEVSCWGSNTLGQLGQGDTEVYTEPVVVSGIDDAVAVSAGGSSACALLGDSTVSCWGTGLLGDGAESTASAPVTVLGLSKVSMISVGENHACAVVDTDRAACWGLNDSGQIGNGTRDPVGLTNVEVGLTDVIAVAAGDLHSCARRSNGQVACWGKNDFGQTGAAPGDDVLTPQINTSIENSSSIAAGVRFTVSSAPISEATSGSLQG